MVFSDFEHQNFFRLATIADIHKCKFTAVFIRLAPQHMSRAMHSVPGLVGPRNDARAPTKDLDEWVDGVCSPAARRAIHQLLPRQHVQDEGDRLGYMEEGGWGLH